MHIFNTLNHLYCQSQPPRPEKHQNIPGNFPENIFLTDYNDVDHHVNSSLRSNTSRSDPFGIHSEKIQYFSDFLLEIRQNIF